MLIGIAFCSLEAPHTYVYISYIMYIYAQYIYYDAVYAYELICAKCSSACSYKRLLQLFVKHEEL